MKLQYAIQSDFRSMALFITQHESSWILNRTSFNCRRPKRIRILLSRDRYSHDLLFNGSFFSVVNNNGGALVTTIRCIVIGLVGLLMQYYAFHNIADFKAQTDETQHDVGEDWLRWRRPAPHPDASLNDLSSGSIS